MNEYGTCPKCGKCLTAHWKVAGNCIQTYCYECDVVYSFPGRENLTLKWAREDKLDERMKNAASKMLELLRESATTRDAVYADSIADRAFALVEEIEEV